ncbi:MAG: glucose dehydrogenase [Acidimicrobiia bacterium]|nr:MAG: glucose dehydrogenase [Acidimicrobiia bacterium]
MRSRLVGLVVFAAACVSPPSAVPTTVPTSTTTTGPVETTPPATSVVTTTSAETTTTSLPALSGLSYRSVATFDFPTVVTARPGDDRLWVATKDGRIWVLGSDGPVFDLSDQVRNRGEQGLLGMAFHPRRPDLLYVHFSANDGDTVLMELSVTDGSSRTLLRIPQPAANHNGGMVAFDEAGLLYLGLGDGGGAGDRFGNGQNTETLLGGIVRIDPMGDPYRVPPSNPFVAGGGAPELWAYGLRNPWRFWIDQDLIYIADVGQDSHEELNVVPLADVGYNFGWPITEGLECFRPARGCDTSGLVMPVIQVDHGDQGTCSITGGVVYRGDAIPELQGTYFYSDFCGGWLRSFRWNGSGVTEEMDWTAQVGTAGQVVSFGIGPDSEMYVATTAEVLRVQPVR